MSNTPNRAPNLLTASGALAAGAALNHITAAAVIALTLVAPTVDGLEMLFIDEGGHAHTIVATGAGSPPTAGLNGGTTNNKLTFNGTIGSSVRMVSRNGFWWSASLNGVAVS